MVRIDGSGNTTDDLKSDEDLWNSIKWKKVNQIVKRLQIRIVKAVSTAGCFNGALSMLEPCEVKVSRRVLRGPGVSNGPRLLDDWQARPTF